MKRTALTFAFAGLTLATGVFTALVQSSNYERARELAELQRSWENLEAINVQREARAAAHVFGPAATDDNTSSGWARREVSE